jgi:nitrous oxidase accessory protein NosD
VKGSASNKWDNGSIGNYWDDYNYPDQNNNGIGDEPYWIEGEVMVDIYPLINRPKIYNNIY